MGVHQCANCSYKSTRTTDVRRHMESKHNAQQIGGNRFSNPQHKANVEEAHLIHSSQHMNLQASDQHSFNAQRSAQDLYSPYDIRLQEIFKLFISGPSRCGKTFLWQIFWKILRHLQKNHQRKLYMFIKYGSPSLMK